MAIDVSEGRFFAIDLEGDGGVPPRPVELSILEVSLEGLGRSRSWLINNERPILPRVSQIHGIFDDDVADCPTFEEIESDVTSLLDGELVIGHNVKVDIDVLSYMSPNIRFGGAFDTLKLVRAMVPGRASYSLSKIAGELGLEVPKSYHSRGSHSSEYDAALAGVLFIYLLQVEGKYSATERLDIAKFPLQRTLFGE